jgi:Domain of unknown function (DUF4365)
VKRKTKTSKGGPTKGRHRSTGRRFTVEQQQEDRSRGQFRDRLSDFGWAVNSKGDRDLGEDVTVDIYDDGKSAGLSFFAQIKSVADRERLTAKKDKANLGYPLEVKDVKHWAVAAHLIVIVIWDVTKHSGVWLTVPEIVTQLKKTTPDWRRQKTVTVHLPVENGTDDRSLHRLRRLVADHNYPIVSRGKTFQAKTTFSFPRTPDGIKLYEALKETVAVGEPVTIAGKYIKSWRLSSWFERLYGKVTPQEVRLAPKPGTEDIPVRLEIDTPEGVYGTPLALRRVKGGREGFTLSNEHQRVPARVQLVARREGQGARINLGLTVTHPVPDVFQTRDATDLLLALGRGSKMRLVHRDTSAVIVESPVPQMFKGRSLASLEEWKPFIDKLCYVQSRIYKHGIVRIRNGRVSNREASFVESFHTICRAGCIERKLRFSAEFGLGKDPWPTLIEQVRRGKTIEMGFDVPDAGHMRILNVKVPLGPMRARHDVASFIDQVERALAARRSSVKVVVPDAVVREEYPNWAPQPAQLDTRPSD